MNSNVTSFNKGFGYCVFMSRTPEDIETTIMEKADKCFGERPVSVKVTPVDELHDKLSLSLSDDNVEGTLTWHKSAAGAHYVLTGLE